ncbi:MAG: hypothetical protein WC059_00075 [Candidatus Paceibacterota bacterium]
MDREQVINAISNKNVGFRQYLWNLELQFPETEDYWFDFLLQIINPGGNRYPVLPKHLYTNEVLESIRMTERKLGDFYNSFMSTVNGNPFGVYFGLKSTKEKGLVFYWFNTIMVNHKIYAVDFTDLDCTASYFGCSIPKNFLVDVFFEYDNYWDILQKFATTKGYNWMVVTAQMRKDSKERISRENEEWKKEILNGPHEMLENLSGENKERVIKWLLKS